MSTYSNRIKLLRKISIGTYIRLNYFCKNIIRDHNSKIIPYKNVRIQLDPCALIELKNGSIELGSNQIKGSREETRVRLGPNAKWICDGGCDIAYGSSLEIQEDAELRTGFFTCNSFTTIVVAKRISFGDDVMIGRNVVIYDSNFHSVDGSKSSQKEEEVVIGDHVWLATGVIVLKGSNIARDCIISAGSVIKGLTIQEKTIIHSVSEVKEIKYNGQWKRSTF